MKNLLFIALVMGVLYPAVGQKKPKEKIITDTAAFLKELKVELRKAMVEDFKPSASEVKERISDDPLPTTITEAAAREMNTAFSNSCYMRPSPFNKDELIVESDNFFYPAPDLVTITLSWTKAVDKSGKNLIRFDSSTTGFLTFKATFNNNQVIKIQGDKPLDIVRAEGEASIKVPVTIARLKLNKTQLNKIETLDTFKVRLLKIDNDLAAAWLDKDYEHVHLYAFNDKGQSLDVHSHSSMVLTGAPNELKGLNLPKDIGKGSFLYIKANGKIDYIEVMTITKYMDQKIKLNVGPMPELVAGKGKLDKERYQEYIPKNFSNLSKPDTSLFTTTNNLKIIKVYSEWNKETKWKLQYKLPSQWVQSAYALPTLKEVSFYLKGKLLKSYEDQGFYDPTSGYMEFEPMDDEYKPLNFDEARGTLELRYPSSLKTVTIKKGEKKYGVEKIDGNKLTLNDATLGDAGEYLNASGLLTLRAYGKGSFPLKQDSYYSSESQNDLSLQHRYYWGNILSVQIDQPGDFMNFSYPFVVKKEDEKKSKKK